MTSRERISLLSDRFFVLLEKILPAGMKGLHKVFGLVFVLLVLVMGIILALLLPEYRTWILLLMGIVLLLTLPSIPEMLLDILGEVLPAGIKNLKVTPILTFALLVLIIGAIFAVLFPGYRPWILGFMALLAIVVMPVYIRELRHTMPLKPRQETEFIASTGQVIPVPVEPPAPPPLDESEMRRMYLQWVFNQTQRINLQGVNLQDAGQHKDTRVSLQGIYTALLTLTPQDRERIEKNQRLEEKPRRKSALQQLNEHRHLVLLGEPGGGKSTFVDFVALCLAGAGLGRTDANLKLLTAPLPDEKGKDEKHPQPWVHGALLPVRIVLRDFVARQLPPEKTFVSLEDFWQYLEGELQKVELAAFMPHLRHYLVKHGGLLLFDGLDEVPEASKRRQYIIQLVEAAAALQKCRVLVTSRTYAYHRQDWVLSDFEVTNLDSFSKGQIIRFVHLWYRQMVEMGVVEHVDKADLKAKSLVESILKNDNIRSLAQRPLLLTLMAGMHAWRGGVLPEKRELLYHETVDLLLERWQQRTVIRHRDGSEEKQPSLEEFLKTGKDNVRRALNELAFEVHFKQPGEQNRTADILEKDLVYTLLNASPQKNDAHPELLKSYLRERAGLLAERGEGVYAFLHRTFQEYLAACHLTDTDFPDYLAELVYQEPERWREVTLIAAAKAVRGAEGSCWNLADALCYENPSADITINADWSALFAGQLLVESANLDRITQRKQKKLEHIQNWLVHILKYGLLPTADRMLAGDVLGCLGDPRFNANHDYLPFSNALAVSLQHSDVMGFVHIPAGPFWMGSRRGGQDAFEDEEYKQHEVELPDFYLGRAPVTVAQYFAYLNSEGKNHLDGIIEKYTNYPIVRVSWFESLDYCKWLTERLRKMGEKILAKDEPVELEALFWRRLCREGWQVLLPSEAEWEKGARGTDGRIYPWGNNDSPLDEHDRANFGLTRLSVSAVGCFPRGASPYGLLDVDGNVWEWTRSLYKKYPYIYNDGREQLTTDEDRVVRGGSFLNDFQGASCDFRYTINPHIHYYSHGFRVAVVAPHPLFS